MKKLKAEPHTVVLVTFKGAEARHIPALLEWLKARKIDFAAPGLDGGKPKKLAAASR